MVKGSNMELGVRYIDWSKCSLVESDPVISKENEECPHQ